MERVFLSNRYAGGASDGFSRTKYRSLLSIKFFTPAGSTGFTPLHEDFAKFAFALRDHPAANRLGLPKAHNDLIQPNARRFSGLCLKRRVTVGTQM
jgi:hypothetical protein